MMAKKSKKQKLKAKSLIWVYPLNKWITNSNKTFVYGWSNPLAKLFVSTEDYLIPQRVNIFPNGNFAKSINLPGIQNNVKLIQIINGEKKLLARHVIVGNAGNTATKRYHKREKVRRLLRQPFRLPRNDTTIVIDPGHGGKEHGTHSPKGVPEKHFNLQIAKMLVETCHGMSLPRCKIYLTRAKDKFVSLKERVNFAKKKKCNILISIHHNALPDYEDPLKHSGVGIYYTHDFVKPFAKKLLESISRETKLKQYGVFKRNFFVTNSKFYRGILIECGFLTHPIEAEYITRKETQKKIVNGIIKGLLT